MCTFTKYTSEPYQHLHLRNKVKILHFNKLIDVEAGW